MRGRKECVEEECGCVEGGGRSVCGYVEGETQNKIVMKPGVSLFRPCAVCDIEDLQFP